MTVARRVVAVAASGGRDSTALLHATARAATPMGVEVVALHVHHGLNAHADAWESHLRQQCLRWRKAGWPVRFQSERLLGAPAPGKSVEAWARAGRYAALKRMATEQGATLLLLAHHQKDQAETVLLQALRGAGPSGLAAMPREADRQGLHWCRPWLACDARAIEAYVKRHRLSHVEDDSNLDFRFDRNRLRHQVWPTLSLAFEHAATGLAQAAHNSARAAELIQEVAQADIADIVQPDGGLKREAWLMLSPARRWYALRAWLAPTMPSGVPDTLLGRLTQELPSCSVGRWPVGEGSELRLYRGVVMRQALLNQGNLVVPEHQPLALNQPGRYALPTWGGSLEMTLVQQGGLPLSLLAQAELRQRQGGEAFISHARGVVRSLKKQYQAAAVPAWQRSGPLVFGNGQLLWVPGLGVDARAQAAAGEPQGSLHWWPALA